MPQSPDQSFVPPTHTMQYLDAALLELDCLVQRHSDVAVLEACARTYGTYCDEGGSAHFQAAPACSRLVDMLVDALTPLLDVFIQHEVLAVGVFGGRMLGCGHGCGVCEGCGEIHGGRVDVLIEDA